MKHIYLIGIIILTAGCSINTKKKVIGQNNKLEYWEAAERKKIKHKIEWVNKKYKVLSSLDINTLKRKPFPELPDYYTKDKWVTEFKDKSWIIITSNTSHMGMGSTDLGHHPVGDMTMIRTSENSYYINSAHVCASICLKKQDKEISSLKVFLQTRGQSGQRWKHVVYVDKSKDPELKN